MGRQQKEHNLALYTYPVSQNEDQGTLATEPPKVLAGFQGPISDLLLQSLRAQGSRIRMDDNCTDLCLASSPTIKSLPPQRRLQAPLWKAPDVGLRHFRKSLWEDPLSLHAEPIYSILMPAVSLLLHPSDSAQLPSVNPLAEPCGWLDYSFLPGCFLFL